MDLKLLEVHPDKCCHLILEHKNVNNIRNEIEQNPLKYKSSTIKEKNKEKWLGETIHNEGVEASIKATINDRKGRVKNAIFELNAIMEDTKMMIIGGVKGALSIWEIGILPMMIHNCDTWTDIDDDDMNELEDLQIFFFQVLCQVP